MFVKYSYEILPEWYFLIVVKHIMFGKHLKRHNICSFLGNLSKLYEHFKHFSEPKGGDVQIPRFVYISIQTVEKH